MIVVSNSSPLIILAKINHFLLLEKLFKKVYISEEVYTEVALRNKKLPGSREVRETEWLAKTKIKNKLEKEKLQKIFKIGEGEASTIVLAKEIKADLVLVDERRARMVAQSEELNVIGTLGLLEISFKKGLISDLRQTYRDLIAEHVRIDQSLLNNSLERFGLKKL